LKRKKKLGKTESSSIPEKAINKANRKKRRNFKSKLIFIWNSIIHPIKSNNGK
jgi:hypothetical protein